VTGDKLRRPIFRWIGPGAIKPSVQSDSAAPETLHPWEPQVNIVAPPWYPSPTSGLLANIMMGH
jgi:hypothetical protein